MSSAIDLVGSADEPAMRLRRPLRGRSRWVTRYATVVVISGVRLV